MAADDKKRTIRLVAPEGVGPFLVHRFSGTEALGRLFEYRVELVSEDGEIAFADLMGQPVTLVIEAKPDDDDDERLIHGYVSHFSLGEKEGRYTRYEAVIVPYLWFVDRVAECRIMPTMMTTPAIVKKVLGDRGYNEVDDSRLVGHYVPRPYCVQYRETDFNFISRLLEDEGIYYYFEHERQGRTDEFKHVMVLCDSRSNHEVGRNCGTLHIADADSAATASIRSWWVSSQAHAYQSHLTDFSYEFRLPVNAGGKVAYDKLSTGATEAAFDPPSDADILGTEADDKRKVGAMVADYPGGFHLGQEKVDRDLVASTRAEEYAVKRIVRHGVTNVHGVVPGATFKLDTKPVEEYLVIVARYQGWSNFGESGSGSPDEEPYQCSFDVIDAKRQFRPARTTPKPRIVGPQTALVVGDKAKRAFTDQFGNVRVKFHWDLDPADDEKCSCLIRVAETWAGNHWGVMFMPRVGHEVVVEFLEGDPDRPLITGRLYNGLAKPPYDPRQHASVSTIKSMTTDDGKGFNELRFEDKKGSEQLFINAHRRMDERVGGSLYETVASSRHEHLGTDDKGDRNRLVSNNLNLHTKGGVFELIEKKLNVNAKQEVVQIYEDNHTIVTTNRQTLNAKEIVIEGKQAVSLKSDKVILQGGSALSLKADNIKIEATQSISLKVGGSFLVLSPSGAFLNASTTFINSGGAPLPADPATSAQEPAITAPIDAAEASSALPGDHVAAGAPATPRVNVTRKVAVIHAPEPHQPPPPPPPDAAVAADRKFLDIAWVETETYCGGAATLKGHTKSYADGTREEAEIRHVVDGATLIAVPLVIQGNAYNQKIDVKDWLPRKSGQGYEESRDEDAYAAGQKTPKPLTMRFVPTLKVADCKLTSRTGVVAMFSMEVKDYVCHVFENITYVRGFMGQLIKLGSHVPATTEGKVALDEGEEDDNTLSGKDWRFARPHPRKSQALQFWNGADWVDVPATWKDRPSGTKLFGIGIWRDGSKNKAESDLTWPNPIPDWTPAQQAQANSVIAKWKSQIATSWTNKFDLRRDGCSSADPKCCRYSVKVDADFLPIAADRMGGQSIVLGANEARSNSFAWSIADTDPGLAPHEFGHHLGCPDEYEGAGTVDDQVTTDIPDPSKPGIDTTCLMGSVPPDSIPPVKARHFDIVKQQLAVMIKSEKGVTFTFTATPHI